MASMNLLRKYVPRVRFVRCIPSLVTGLSPKSTKIDVLDVFTNDLLRKLEGDKKPRKEFTPMTVDHAKESLIRKITSHQIDQTLPFEHSMDIRDLSAAEFNGYVSMTIGADDRRTFNGIVEQIHRFQILPRNDLVVRSLRYLCDDKNDTMTLIVRLIDVCREKNIQFYATDMEFAPFLAQYLWTANRYDSALSVLRQTSAGKNVAVKTIVRQNFQRILKDAIANRGESAMEKIEAFASEMFRTRGDPSLLLDMFNDCFVSPWFSDRTIATNLFRQWQPLRTSFRKDIGQYAYDRLQQHDVDAVRRLIELCLEFKLMEECRICLVMLFDYQCKCIWTNESRRILIFSLFCSFQIGAKTSGHAPKI